MLKYLKKDLIYLGVLLVGSHKTTPFFLKHWIEKRSFKNVRLSLKTPFYQALDRKVKFSL